MLSGSFKPGIFFGDEVSIRNINKLEPNFLYLSPVSGQLAKNWYVDGTFKLCKAPFTQLLTVNAFVRSEDHAKQVPLVFALMSGKMKKDHKAVIREIIKIIPGQPSVKKVTVDFERAIWSAFQEVLPEVRIMGCAFHWTQALWRKVNVARFCYLKLT